MDPFKWQHNTLNFWDNTGEVLSSDKRSETRVSSSGGGGFVHKGSGVIAATKTHSSVTTIHDFWIKDINGQEIPVNLSGIDIPMRENQRVSMIYTQREQDTSAQPILLVNHSSKQHWKLQDGKNLNKIFKFEVTSGFSLLYAFLAFVTIMFTLMVVKEKLNLDIVGYDNNLSFAATTSTIFFIFLVIRRFTRISELEKSLDKHIESIAQNAHQNL